MVPGGEIAVADSGGKDDAVAMVPEPFSCFCRMAIYTGLRRGELLGLLRVA